MCCNHQPTADVTPTPFCHPQALSRLPLRPPPSHNQAPTAHQEGGDTSWHSCTLDLNLNLKSKREETPLFTHASPAARSASGRHFLSCCCRRLHRAHACPAPLGLWVRAQGGRRKMIAGETALRAEERALCAPGACARTPTLPRKEPTLLELLLALVLLQIRC